MSKTKLEEYFWACYVKERKSLDIFVNKFTLSIQDGSGTEVISSVKFDFIDEIRKEVRGLANELKQRGYEVTVNMKPEDYFADRNKEEEKEQEAAEQEPFLLVLSNEKARGQEREESYLIVYDKRNKIKVKNPNIFPPNYLKTAEKNLTEVLNAKGYEVSTEE
jgi:hypothetical protein